MAKRKNIQKKLLKKLEKTGEELEKKKTAAA